MFGYFKELREIIRYRELLKNLVTRDLKVRYRRSFLGFIWALLNPLLMTIVLYVVFSNAFGGLFGITSKNFTVYLLSGIVTWNFFSQGTVTTVQSFLGNGSLIKKVYIPKSILPLSANLSALINFLFSIIPLVVLIVLTRTPIGPHFYMLPFVLCLLLVFCFGISLFLSTITVFFQDMVHIYEVVLLAWMYATPIFYPESIIPHKFLFILRLNPMYYYIRLFRGSLYMGVPSLSHDFLYGTIFALVSLAAGSFFYVKYRKRIVYYL